jgi:hypothetical protein
MKKRSILLFALLCTFWGIAMAQRVTFKEKVTPFEDGASYYIVNTAETFKTQKAITYSKLDTRFSQNYGFLYWADLAKQDPRCIFTFKKSGDGYTITSFDGTSFANLVPKDSILTMTPDADTDGVVQYFDETPDGYYLIWSDSLTVYNKKKEAVGHNYIYPDSHAFGGNAYEHIGANRFWTLKDSVYAQWDIIKVEDADLTAATAKNDLASVVMSISNPNVYGTGGASPDAGLALREKWNECDSVLKATGATANFETLGDELIRAKSNADNSSANITDGLYFLENTYSKFPSIMSMRYGQDDQNCVSSENAFLYWDVLNKEDPRFIFRLTKMTDDGGYAIENYGTGWCIDGMTNSVITMSPTYTSPQYLTDSGDGTYYIHNSATGGNNFYPDSHGFGGGQPPHNIGANNWWTLDDNAAAKWSLVKLSQAEISAISDAKLKLCKTMGTVNDPNIFGQGDMQPAAYAALKEAYQAAKEAIVTTESDETYEELNTKLQDAINKSKQGTFTFEDGYYYIESAFSSFPETVAMAYDKIDNTGANLCYEPLVEGDPKFMFVITRTGDSQYSIQNVGSNKAITYTGNQEGFVNYFAFMGSNAVNHKLEFNEDTTCAIISVNMPSNHYYAYNNEYGEVTKGHIAMGDAWTEVPEAAVWRLVPISDDDMVSLTDEKLDLCSYLSETFNPFVVGTDPGYVTQETYDNFNNAYTWATGGAADNTTDEETCVNLMTNLQEAREAANAEVLPIRENGLYYIVSKYYNYISTGRQKAMCYIENLSAPDQSLSWSELQESDSAFIFKFTAASDTSYNVQNMKTGKYISSLTSDFISTIVSSDSIAQVLTPIGFGEYRIKPASTLYRNRPYYQDATGYGGNEQGLVGANGWSMDCNNAWSLVTYGQEIKIGESGYASVVLPYNCYVPDGVKAYALTKPVATADGLTEISGHIVAAGVPFIVAGPAGTYTFEKTEGEGVTPTGNLLKGSFIKATAVDNGQVLVLNSAKGGNLLVPNTDNVPLGEVYIDASTVEGINSVKADKTNDSNAKYYDLQGRRVFKPAKGIFIKDGQKVAVK